MSSKLADGFIPPIEGLRGVAIVLVIVSHLGYGDIVPGGFGVTLFFFISGFLITHLLLRERGTTGDIAIGKFYLRRFLRLAPALLTMVAVVALTYLLMGVKASASELLVAIFYVMNYFVIFGGVVTLPFGTLWSLAVEEHYYLLYPGILRAVAVKPRAMLTGMVLLVCAVLAWRCVLVFEFHASDDRTYIATDTRIDSIMYGAILAVLMEWKSAILVQLCRPVVFACAIIVLLSTFVIRNDDFRQTLRYSLQGVALMPLFYSSVFVFRWMQAILENSALLWIGRLSYSLYLWHFAVFAFIYKFTALTPAAGLPVIFALAALSYYFVELPCRQLRRRLHATPQQA